MKSFPSFLCLVLVGALGLPTPTVAAEAVTAETLTVESNLEAVEVSSPSADAAILRRQFLRLHQQAAKGDGYAEARLAEWKRHGVGEASLYVNVAKIAKLAKTRKEPPLFGRLGLAYLRGEGGLTPDVPQGLALLEKASAAGDNEATLNLGLQYHSAPDNKTIPTDLVKARQYFSLLAERGDPRGLLELGWVLHEHEQDYARAAEYFERSGDAGLADGYSLAGWCLRKMTGAKAKDRQRGLELIEKAAEKGNINAAIAAGLIYISGEPGIPRDVAKAAKLLNQTIEQGDQRLAQRVLLALDDPRPVGKNETAVAQAKRQLRADGMKDIRRQASADPQMEKLLKHLQILREKEAVTAN